MGQDYRPELDRIDGFARIAVLGLRASAISDDEIINVYTQPHLEADARFEHYQRRELGYVAAPAGMVKARMRQVVRAVAA